MSMKVRVKNLRTKFADRELLQELDEIQKAVERLVYFFFVSGF